MTDATIHPAGCTYPTGHGRTCDSQETETLSNLGRRCAQHAPRYAPEHAAGLIADGFVDTAGAYARESA